MSETEKHSKGQTRLTANRTEMGFQLRSEGWYWCDLRTVAPVPLQLLVDGERAGGLSPQQLRLLVDFGKGDVSFCLGTVRNADDPLPTAPITSAETSLVIVAFHASLLPFLNIYIFLHLFLIHCPDFSPISPFPTSLLSALLTSFSQSTFQHHLPHPHPTPHSSPSPLIRTSSCPPPALLPRGASTALPTPGQAGRRGRVSPGSRWRVQWVRGWGAGRRVGGAGSHAGGCPVPATSRSAFPP